MTDSLCRKRKMADSFIPCVDYIRQEKQSSTHLSRTLQTNLHAPAEDRTGDPSIYCRALYHVAIKGGLYRKAVQVNDIPNLYPVTQLPLGSK